MCSIYIYTPFNRRANEALKERSVFMKEIRPWYLASILVHGIEITRYVSSWYIGGGTQSYHKAKEWLRTLTINGEALSEEEVTLIADCIVTGKLELQDSVKDFLAK